MTAFQSDLLVCECVSRSPPWLPFSSRFFVGGLPGPVCIQDTLPRPLSPLNWPIRAVWTEHCMTVRIKRHCFYCLPAALHHWTFRYAPSTSKSMIMQRCRPPDVAWRRKVNNATRLVEWAYWFQNCSFTFVFCCFFVFFNSPRLTFHNHLVHLAACPPYLLPLSHSNLLNFTCRVGLEAYQASKELCVTENRGLVWSRLWTSVYHPAEKLLANASDTCWRNAAAHLAGVSLI